MRQHALDVAAGRRNGAQDAQRLAEFDGVAQMVFPEARQRRAPFGVVEPVDRRLIGVGGVEIELNEVGEQADDIGFGSDRGDW